MSGALSDLNKNDDDPLGDLDLLNSNVYGPDNSLSKTYLKTKGSSSRMPEENKKKPYMLKNSRDSILEAITTNDNPIDSIDNIMF